MTTVPDECLWRKAEPHSSGESQVTLPTRCSWNPQHGTTIPTNQHSSRAVNGDGCFSPQVYQQPLNSPNAKSPSSNHLSFPFLCYLHCLPSCPQQRMIDLHDTGHTADGCCQCYLFGPFSLPLLSSPTLLYFSDL